MSKKARKQKKETARKPPTSRVRSEVLSRVQDAMANGQWHEAHQLLESLRQRNPDDVAVLRALAESLHYLGKPQAYLVVVLRLARLRPDDDEIALGLAAAYAMAGFAGLARRVCRDFLSRFPASKRLPDAQELLAKVEELWTERRLDCSDLSTADVEAALELADEMRLALMQGRLDEAVVLGERARALTPGLLSNLNNLSSVYHLSGQRDAALLVSGEAIARAPDNPVALAEHTRNLLLCGYMEEARACGERLKAAPLGDRRHVPVKVAEALSYLGDDRGVLEVVTASEKLGPPNLADEHAHLLHLAAVASFRLGDEMAARGLWAKAIRLAPEHPLIASNLAEIDKRVGSGHGPWAILASEWAPMDIIEEFLEGNGKTGTPEAFAQAAQQLLREQPRMAALLPLWLDRGSPMLRNLAVLLLNAVRSKEALAALRDFALGQRGPDEQRREALHTVVRAGLLPRAPVQMWMGGEWKEVVPLAWELVPETEPWVPELPAPEAEEVERWRSTLPPMLKSRGLRIPWAPQAEALHERFPDAVLPAAVLAICEARRGRLARAEARLRPYLLRAQLHRSELSALCQAQVEIATPRTDRVEMMRWLKLWHDTAPKDPIAREYLPLFGVAEIGERLGASPIEFKGHQ
jgi:tetratricopeptide (TPR) repeat protein